MGKSIRAVLNGSAEAIHGMDEPIGSELFNSTAVYKGPWQAIYDGAHPTGKWQLYNIVADPAQNTNLADVHPDLLQQMITDYQNYAEEVGIVIPTGAKFQFQISHLVPPMNETQTIDVRQIVPPADRNLIRESNFTEFKLPFTF